MTGLLSTYDWDELRRRRSVKWREYPPDVLPMWVAEMDTPLAPPVAEALDAAVRRGDTGYAALGGLPESFAGFAERTYGWSPDPAAMRLVPDVMRGIAEMVGLLTGPGDRVVVHTPAYPPFFSWLRRIGRSIVENPLTRGPAGYGLDLERLEHDFAAGAAVYLLCNPHNPTGRVFTRAELLDVAELADRYQVRVLADEIHAPLTYADVRHTPFASLDVPSAQRSITFTSASKAWNLAGLKSALAVPGPLAAAEAAGIEEEIGLGAGLLGVLASEAAFAGGEAWLADLLAELDANRRLLGDLLSEHLPGVGYHLPQATYLAWLDCRSLSLGDDPADAFLSKGRVALSHGPSFGEPGRGFARLNFATAPERVAEAVRRMAATAA